jgi:hypothetical protein
VTFPAVGKPEAIIITETPGKSSDIGMINRARIYNSYEVKINYYEKLADWDITEERTNC